MLTALDYFVIAGYFAFLSGLGWYFRRFARNTSDYFRGGGAMPWWLVGASMFASAFSAWTFTGAAGLAFEHGLVVVMIYLANAVGFLTAAFFLAAWYRQTRVITAMEAVGLRFGCTNEQIFTWLQVPVQLVISAVWLYGLAIFLAPIFGFDLRLCILIGGAVVVFMSSAGGAWAVITGDFMQALLLVPVTAILAYFSLQKVGGGSALLHALPSSHTDLLARSAPGFGVLWVVALLVEKIVLGNGLPSATRFLCVRNSRDARKAAVLAAGLTLAGAVLWFLPPLAARALGLDLAHRFPGLSNPAESAYAAMAIDLLPHGILGLLVTGIVGTTLSAMDTGLNRNSGIFVRSIYLPLVRPHATERELMLASRITTVAMGVVIVGIALLYSTWQDIGVFRLMMNIAAMLGVPAGIPMFLCLFFRRTPDWTAWSTLATGFATSALLLALPTSPVAWQLAETLHGRGALEWLVANEYSGRMLINASICTLWFVGTLPFAGRLSPARSQVVTAFFAAMHTPIPVESGATEAGDTARRIGWLCAVYAVLLTVVVLLPNSASGRISVAVCAGAFYVTAGWLHLVGRRR